MLSVENLLGSDGAMVEFCYGRDRVVMETHPKEKGLRRDAFMLS